MRDGDLIILLGAGCSVEAGIPASRQMVTQLEADLAGNQRWEDYRELYYFLKAALIYTDCMKQRVYGDPDIERLVNTLGELEKNRDCTLYPFIGSWNQRLLELGGRDFELVREFRQKIIGQLRDWIAVPNYGTASYYGGLFRLQEQFDFPIRIFSLNYDLCVEKTAASKLVETGFDHATATWDGTRFESREEDAPAIYLYKLHGSIDWYRDRKAGNILKLAASPQPEPDLIFGTDYKMQYIDPYLFYAYELRRYSLQAKVILTIGYSFRDEHINGIIKQALNNSAERTIIAVSNEAAETIKSLGAQAEQCRSHDAKARSFLENLTLKQLQQLAGIDTANSGVPF